MTGNGGEHATPRPGRYAPMEMDVPRPGWPLRFSMCEDCGALVHDRQVHDRFHSILGSHAWALAVLKAAHIAPHVHDKYEVGERIDSKRFDNWSAEAFAEVVASLPDGEPEDDDR